MQFYFGASERRLFGVYHEAVGQATARTAVLLCNPFGADAVRSNRIFRVLAEQLAQAGYPVLRFDYFGAGDSAGACEAFTLAGAGEDISTAHQMLLDQTGGARIIWVGLRLGAALALQRAQTAQRSPAGLLLWDPVLVGADYLQMLGAAHLKDLAHAFELTTDAMQKKMCDGGALHEAQGFAMSSELFAELEALNGLDVSARPARVMSVLAARQTEMIGQMLAVAEGHRSKVSFYTDDEVQNWDSDAAMNAFVVPRKTIAEIVRIIGELR